MIDAMAQAAGALDEPRYLKAAERAAAFVLEKMRRGDGRLLHTWRGGQAKVDAYLDDYASFINALVSLYEAGFDERWIDAAVELADQMLAHFTDRDYGGFFYTADDGEQLITRQKDLQDSATPSGNSMAATALVRLGKLTGRNDYLEGATGAMRSAVGLMQKYPAAAGQMLLAVDLHVGPTYEIAILGDPKEQATRRAARGSDAAIFSQPGCSRSSGGFRVEGSGFSKEGDRSVIRGTRGTIAVADGLRLRELRLPGAGEWRR